MVEFIAICCLLLLLATSAHALDCPRWQPVDLEFQGADDHDNPFAIEFSATAEGPDGLRMDLPGFHNGDTVWVIRFAPPVEGQWKLTTRASGNAPELNGRTREVSCIANPDPDVHGGLIVDPENPYHFVYEDGTRHFLSGYECDWIWALPEDKLLPFLDRLGEHGFNHVLMNAYAHDCVWRKGKTSPEDYGPPPMYAWLGTNNEPNFHRYNLDYWRHYDMVIREMAKRGITAHIMIKVYNKMVRWPERNSPEEKQYFRWVMARYSAFSNVIWDFSKETCNEKNLEYKMAMFGLMRDLEPYGRLITTHDDHDYYDKGVFDDLLDFESDQQHNHWMDVIAKHRARRRCPAVNVEYGYEHGPEGIEDMTYRVVQAPEEVLRRAWLVNMAGGYGAYYYTYTAWDVIRSEDTPPGYAYLRHMAGFFNSVGYWAMNPADDLVNKGHCLARPGEEYVVYLEKPEATTLEIEGAAAPLAAEWFDPLTGERRPCEALENGSASLTPPWQDGPAALHVGTPPELGKVERVACKRRATTQAGEPSPATE